MNVLIIGSKGFIGSHFMRMFTSKQYNVFGCDIISDPDNKQYFHADPANLSFDKIFQDSKIEVCINCSGAANVGDSFIHPQNDFDLNVSNVYKILDAIRKHAPGCKFIQLSSAAVYGNPQHLPIAENAALHPISPYGFHKLYSENICKEFAVIFNLKITVIRLFSVYGPGLRKQIFWDTYKKYQNNPEAIQLFGTGKESRDFIYIEDVCNAVEKIIEAGNFTGEVINVTGGKEITIAKAVGLLLQNLPGNCVLSFNNTLKEGDPLNWRADITKLKQLGFEQSISFEEGIKITAEWMEKN